MNIPFENRGEAHKYLAMTFPNRRLNYGLDVIKAVALGGGTDPNQKAVAKLVELYDELAEHLDSYATILQYALSELQEEGANVKICWVCEEPISDDDIHSDPSTGEDVHGKCCSECS